MPGTYTLTFGDQVENHVGNQQLGQLALTGQGFNHEDLIRAKRRAKTKGFKASIIDLRELSDDRDLPEAFILVVWGFARSQGDDVREELESFEWDSKFYNSRRRVVQNKHARANVCFGEAAQEPDYERGKGRVVPFDEVEEIDHLRDRIGDLLGEKAVGLYCEGNKYADKQKNGIGWHGDTERRKVVGVRFEEDRKGKMPLMFNWFTRSKPFGKTLELNLGHGDLYVMSEEATGFNWMRSSLKTLRHSAGASKYTKFKPEWM